MNSSNPVKVIFCLLMFVLTGTISKSQPKSTFKLISSAFEDGKPVPAKYTCDSSNVSPALSWSGFPEKTKSFALIMDDPDAPMEVWVHWVIYNIPSNVTTLTENQNTKEIKALEGLNSWFEKGYNGPCPPGGSHHYIFKLYALDQLLTNPEKLTKPELIEAMKGYILDTTTLTGIFRVE